MLLLVKLNSEFTREAWEEAKATLALFLFFGNCEEKDYYHVISVGQLNFDCRSYRARNHRIQGLHHFIHFFYVIGTLITIEKRYYSWICIKFLSIFVSIFIIKIQWLLSRTDPHSLELGATVL